MPTPATLYNHKKFGAMKSKLTIAFVCLCFAVNVAGQCWQQLALGELYMVAIQKDETLWAWGEGGFGNLGNGTVFDKNLPTEITCTTIHTNTAFQLSPIIQVLPNPVLDHAIIRVTGISTTDLTFEVRNVLGELVITRQGLTDNRRVDFSILAPGIYNLTITTREGPMSRQIIKI
jgi:hypothetical protein